MMGSLCELMDLSSAKYNRWMPIVGIARLSENNMIAEANKNGITVRVNLESCSCGIESFVVDASSNEKLDFLNNQNWFEDKKYLKGIFVNIGLDLIPITSI